MKRNFAWFLFCSFVMCLGSSAVAKEKKPKPGPLTGTWECISHGGPQGDLPFTLHLDQTKETVTGSVDSPMGSTQLTSAQFNKKTVEIHIDTAERKYVLTGKLKKDELRGEWSTDAGRKGIWEGKKSAAKSP